MLFARLRHLPHAWRNAQSRHAKLLAQLGGSGALRVERVALPGTEQSLPITRPHDRHARRTGEVPYWAEIWPSGVVLAGMIAREPQRLQGQRVLELGPGLGVAAVAALQAGAELVIVDEAPEALVCTALNTLEQVGREPVARRLSWRQASTDLISAAGAGFALVLGADVLYEARDVQALRRLLPRLVAPGGELWLADPGRGFAEQLVRTLHQQGWQEEREECLSAHPDPHEHTRDIITVYRLRRLGP
jgi:predicted nicotinamide N-methyase